MAETAHSQGSTADPHGGHGHGGHGGGGHGHHDAREHEKHYWKIYWILLVLLVVSVIGPFIGEATEIFAITLFTAFGIAFVKAALVVKNFMHLNLEPKFVTYISATALALMALFFFWVAPDVMRHEGHQWVNQAAKAVTGQAAAGLEGHPFDAREVYANACAGCHGVDGEGDGPAAGSLRPRPPDFTSARYWERYDRAHAIEVIARGGKAVGGSPLMPAFGDIYTEDQIMGFADYLMTFRPEEPIRTVQVPPAPEPQVDERPVPETEEAIEQLPGPEEGLEQPVEVAEAAAPTEPEGISPAEEARRAAWITRRLYQ